MASKFMPVDVLLVEGFKAYPHEKLEIYRPAAGNPLLCLEDDHIVAVASDGPVPEAQVPVIDLDDIAAIADFILSRTELTPAKRGVA